MNMTVWDVIGLFGVAAYVYAYAMLQLEKLRASDNLYLLLNGAGSALILVSLIYSFNLPSFITQSLWLIFTIIGFLRARRHGSKAECG